MNSSPGRIPSSWSFARAASNSATPSARWPARTVTKARFSATRATYSGLTLLGRAVGHVEERKGLLGAASICLNDSEVRCRLEADLSAQSPVLQKPAVETCGRSKVTLVGE